MTPRLEVCQQSARPSNDQKEHPQLVVLPAGSNYKAEVRSPEDTEEKASRLRNKDADENLRRWKEASVFFVSLFGGVAVAVACIFVLITGNASPESKVWAERTLIGLGGVAATLIGVKANKN